MAIQTLADLRTRVVDWSNRKDLSNAQVDDFINIAQTRLIRLLRIPPFEATATINFTNTNKLAVPQDFIEAINLTVTTNNRTTELERKDITFVQQRAHVEGIPRYFSRRGLDFEVAPKPAQVTNATLFYMATFLPLIVDLDSNFLVTDAPDAMLYGALTELGLFTKNQASAAIWEAKFQSAALELQKMADDAEWSGSTISVLPSPNDISRTRRI